MKTKTTVVLTVTLAAIIAISAFAAISYAAVLSNAQPANKVVASGSTIQIVNATSGDVTLLTCQMKTSTPEDLVLQLTMETALYIKVSAKGGQGDTAVVTNKASAGVVAWIEVDGVAVPVTNIQANTEGGGTDDGKVTIDNRVFGISYSLPTLNSTEFITLWIDTKSTHGFNWVSLNVGSGTHTIVVKAHLDAAYEGDPTMTGASAAVGKRTLVVEPTKLANNALI